MEKICKKLWYPFNRLFSDRDKFSLWTYPYLAFYLIQRYDSDCRRIPKQNILMKWDITPI